jgi:hypothetical protein
MKSKYKKDDDYEFVGITEDPKWAIRFLKGEYKEVIIRYDDVKLETANGKIPENEDEELTLSFGYTILNNSALSESYDDNVAGQYFGDVLMDALMSGLEEGTTILNERESK